MTLLSVTLTKDPDALAAVGLDPIPGPPITLINVVPRLCRQLQDAGLVLHVEVQDHEHVLPGQELAEVIPIRRT
jgi:hypothetical protein